MLSISCLNFLVRLLDNEFNPEVELYLKLFKSRKITDYQLLRLEEIIKYNKHITGTIIPIILIILLILLNTIIVII